MSRKFEFPAGLNKLSWSPKGSYIVAASLFGLVVVDTRSLKNLLAVDSGNEITVEDVSFSANEKLLASTDRNGTTSLWDLEKGKITAKRRLLALAAIYEGATRTRGCEHQRRDAADRARLGGEVQCAWPRRSDRPQGSGPAAALNDEHRAALAAIIESGPIPAIHGVVRWRIVDLCQWLSEEFRVVVAKQTLSRELRAMGYRKLFCPSPPSCPGRRRRWRF